MRLVRAKRISLPLDEFLQFPIVVLAKFATDGLFMIGQLALVTARFGPKDCQFGPQEPSIEVGMLKYKFAQMGAS